MIGRAGPKITHKAYSMTFFFFLVFCQGEREMGEQKHKIGEKGDMVQMQSRKRWHNCAEK